MTGAGYTDNFEYGSIVDLAKEAKGEDPFGYRVEFINLVRMADEIDDARE